MLEGHEDAVNMYCRQQNRRTSNFGWSDATKPPTAPRLLAEGAGDEVHPLLDGLRFRGTAAVRSEHADRMGFVDQEVGAVPLLHLGKLGERRLIAKHAVDAFDDDQLAFALVGQARQTPVEIVRIVVAKTHHRRAAEPAAVVDARMRSRHP